MWIQFVFYNKKQYTYKSTNIYNITPVNVVYILEDKVLQK